MEVFLSLGEKGVMAVLKDLIVHGPSRFVNGISTNSIKADEGIFKFLKAEDLTANKATVVGLLDVQGELHTNKWTSTNIANIGGTFYISPTYKSTTATLQFGGTANNRSIIINGSFGSASASGLAMSAWEAQSKVMMTGSITYNGTAYPLGTCDGVLSTAMSSTGFRMTGVNSAAVETLYAIIGTKEVDATNIEISMRTIAGTKPVGILLTSYGVSQATYIDIHGGVNSNTGTPSVPNAKPNVRVGYLNGLPSFTIAGVTTATPSGWGIYTDNGYFKGKIAADGGVIGGFTISELQLYTGTHSSYTAEDAGLFLGKESDSSPNYYVAGGPYGQWWLKSDGTAKIGDLTFLKDESNNFVLNVPAVNITGQLTTDQLQLPENLLSYTNYEYNTANTELKIKLNTELSTDESYFLFLQDITLAVGTSGTITGYYGSEDARQSNAIFTINGSVSGVSTTYTHDKLTATFTPQNITALAEGKEPYLYLVCTGAFEIGRWKLITGDAFEELSTIDELDFAMDNLSVAVDGMNETLLQVGPLSNCMKVVTDDTGKVFLSIVNLPYQINITSDGIYFQQKESEEATPVTISYMKNDLLYIPKSKVTDIMQIGYFAWETRENGRVSLMYRPETGEEYEEGDEGTEGGNE